MISSTSICVCVCETTVLLDATPSIYVTRSVCVTMPSWPACSTFCSPGCSEASVTYCVEYGVVTSCVVVP